MIHLFEHNGEHIALDIASGAVHSMDALSYIICERVGPPLAEACPPELISELSGSGHGYDAAEIREAYDEICRLYREGLLFSEDEFYLPEEIKPGDIPVKALCLHVSHDCNLRCDYCFAKTGDFGTSRSLMKPETARRAIEFVIENSGPRRNIEIDFFGGEPLMAWETVKETINYANEQAGKHNKRFRFTITTNGVLLDDEKIEYINKNMSNVVLSVDGRRKINDSMRKTAGGKGSYDIVMPKFKKLVAGRDPDKDYYVRGTFTSRNLDFSKDVFDLYENGFDQISIEPVTAPAGCGCELSETDLPAIREEYWALAEKILDLEARGGFMNFFHFNVDLEQGPCVIKRLRGCGAGCEYVAVTPEGDIYPCHQFVGKPEFLMGNVADGTFDRNKASMFAGVSVYTRESCHKCWARYYCSGGCSAANFNSNGDIDIAYELGCELEKMRLECALYLAVRRS